MFCVLTVVLFPVVAVVSIHVHTYFICHKLSITEYKYYVDSNGRLPEKLVLIVLV